jgi:hypothetical protein
MPGEAVRRRNAVPYGTRSLEILRHLSAGDLSAEQLTGAPGAGTGVKKTTIRGLLLRLYGNKEVERRLLSQGTVLLRPGLTRRKRFYVYSITDVGIARLNRALSREAAARKDRKIQ